MGWTFGFDFRVADFVGNHVLPDCTIISHTIHIVTYFNDKDRLYYVDLLLWKVMCCHWKLTQVLPNVGVIALSKSGSISRQIYPS